MSRDEKRQEENRWRETDGWRRREKDGELFHFFIAQGKKLRNESKRHGIENTPPSIPPSIPSHCANAELQDQERRDGKTETPRRRPSK